jgi:hypothetical protein
MDNPTKILTDDEMINYYMHKIDTGETNFDKKMNEIFYKNTKKCKIDTDSDFTSISCTPITSNKDKSNCLFCFPAKWSKIFDVNDK